jgi:hypothetical protein
MREGPFCPLTGKAKGHRIAIFGTNSSAKNGFCASNSAIGGHGRAGLGGFSEGGFLVLLKIVHVEVAVSFKPVFLGFDG